MWHIPIRRQCVPLPLLKRFISTTHQLGQGVREQMIREPTAAFITKEEFDQVKSKLDKLESKLNNNSNSFKFDNTKLENVERGLGTLTTIYINNETNKIMRRRKIQARPNIASAAVSHNPADLQQVKSPAPQQAPSTPMLASMGSPAPHQQTAPQDQPSAAMEQPEQLQNVGTPPAAPIPAVMPEEQQQIAQIQIPMVEHQIEQQQQVFAQLQQVQPVQLQQHGMGNELQHGHGFNNAERFEPERSANQLQLPPLQFHREVPTPANPPCSVEPPTPIEQQKKRREPPRDKLCDTKTFTMADLVSWRPKTENTLRKKWAEKRKLYKQQVKEEAAAAAAEDGDNAAGPSNSNPNRSFTKSAGLEKPATIGPRVKINERGEMVVDEESLVLVENPEDNKLETVNDDYMPKKLTSMSFKKNFKRGTMWGVLETDLFYEVLAATGTDFGLMHEFIPTRSRAELKQKFTREQRKNPGRMDETLRNPVLLDERLRQRVERMLEEMAHEPLANT